LYCCPLFSTITSNIEKITLSPYAKV
jgi:hypothetical protein